MALEHSHAERSNGFDLRRRDAIFRSRGAVPNTLSRAWPRTSQYSHSPECGWLTNPVGEVAARRWRPWSGRDSFRIIGRIPDRPGVECIQASASTSSIEPVPEQSATNKHQVESNPSQMLVEPRKADARTTSSSQSRLGRTRAAVGFSSIRMRLIISISTSERNGARHR